MGIYRQLSGRTDEEVAKAIRELYDFVYAIKGRVDEQEKKVSTTPVPSEVPAQEIPSLAVQGLNLRLVAGPITISSGRGSPNNVIIGSPGDLFLNLNGGANTTLYVKESGVSTTTGWVAK